MDKCLTKLKSFNLSQPTDSDGVHLHDPTTDEDQETRVGGSCRLRHKCGKHESEAGHGHLKQEKEKE